MKKRFIPTRRAVLTGAAALAASQGLPAIAFAREIRDFQLTPKPATVNLVGAKWPDTDVWAFDGKVPGPELRVRQGERFRIHVQNALDEPTTVHWHGLRLPNAMDGVPDLTQPPIQPGASFTYEFDAVDAGTFWYHPHVRSSVQVGRGLYGALIVEEANPPKVDRDITWVIDDWRLTEDAAISDDFGHMMDISHGGRSGNVVTVNGNVLDNFDVRAGERIRLRLLNTANARIFGLKFDGHSPQVIALDGHPVSPHTPEGDLIVLGPGMRADVIIDFGQDPGATFEITDALYARSTYRFATIRYGDTKPLRTSALDAPTALPPNPVPEPDLKSAEHHTITIEGGAMGGMRDALFKGEKTNIRDLVRKHGKVWALNGIVFDGMDMAPLLSLKHGASHVIEMRNNTGWEHPMHLHGHAFRVLSRNGVPVPHTPWGDTVLLDRNDTVEIALVADNPGDWLFHCHILEHHAGGMAGIVRVV